jgi:hypothetical protein
VSDLDHRVIGPKRQLQDCHSGTQIGQLLGVARVLERMDETQANVSLIAAAPDMLAALRDTLDYWESTGFAECADGCDCIVESVRAAIARAEGQ